MWQYYYYPSFSDGETEAKKVQVSGPDDIAIEWQNWIRTHS